MDDTAIWETVRLVLACGLYLAVALVTSRGFIAAPVRRVLIKQVELCLAEVRMRSAMHPNEAATTALTTTLQGLMTAKREWWRRLLWAFDSPLTKLHADLRGLNAAQRGMVELVPDEALADYAAPLLLQLSTVDKKAEEVLGARLNASTSTEGKRLVIRHVHQLTQADKENDLAAEFDDQRIALWLAIVGLFGVVALGLMASDHQITLLLGAIGGFLAPMVRLSTGQKASSWGVMVLSPVGGALTAVGGLLLVRLLSDENINVLGEVFRDNSWEAPSAALAMALALLFGFSGRLFSRLAIASTTQLAPAAQDPEPGAATGGKR